MSARPRAERRRPLAGRGAAAGAPAGEGSFPPGARRRLRSLMCWAGRRGCESRALLLRSQGSLSLAATTGAGSFASFLGSSASCCSFLGSSGFLGSLGSSGSLDSLDSSGAFGSAGSSLSLRSSASLGSFPSLRRWPLAWRRLVRKALGSGPKYPGAGPIAAPSWLPRWCRGNAASGAAGPGGVGIAPCGGAGTLGGGGPRGGGPGKGP
mmetsp:Transcript_59990/g.178556  ORF Transcript_59990/g.178556 Transcript_59990/m.178556 type:complete len:209 (-) Transcript_59990:2040-2666(-)